MPWTWNPDSGLPLTSGSVSVTGVEATSSKLWGEFISGWLDGGTHTLFAASTKMPALTGLIFNDGKFPESMDGLYLQISTEMQSSLKKRLWTADKWMITEHARVVFRFRSLIKTGRSDGHNSASLVRWGSDSLFAILQAIDPVAPLLRKGMGIFRPSRPILSGGGLGTMRQMTLSVCYTYPAESVNTTIVGADGQFFRFRDGYLELWDDTDSLWHTATAAGTPVYLALSEVGNAETANLAYVPSGTRCRLKEGQLQLFNADTSLWHALSAIGIPPQFTLSETGEA